MSGKRIYLLSLVILVYSGQFSEGIIVNCTTKCDCDIYENLRRANCDDGKMLTLIDNVPKQAEILEFSYNFLSILDNKIFYKIDLTTLKLLNLSHNQIQDVKVHAFYKLDKLKSLDLSSNYLQFLLPQWFWNLPAIEEFYINHNNLGKLQNEPFIESDTLKVLSLAHCKIPHLQIDLFSGLPNLEHINLSGNALYTVKPQLIRPLKNLQTLSIKENMLECDANAIEFSEFCAEKRIELDYEICRKKTEKSQKIIVVPKERKIKKQNAWIIEDFESIEVSKSEVECPTLNETKDTSLLSSFLEIYPIATVLVTLIVGFAVGLLVGFGIKVRSMKRSFSKRRKPRITGGFDYIEQSLIDHVQGICESTPMPCRKTNDF